MNKKSGATAISTAIVIAVGIGMLCMFLAFAIDCITPLILKQKLQMIANKYMYVIEKYGYFTETEKESLIKELKQSGFEQEKIQLDYPRYVKPYGEVLEFAISYKYNSIPLFGMEDKNIVITKVSYSKR